MVVGGQEPEVQVEIVPEKLRAYGLTINDVANAVRGQFLSTSGGDVKTGSGDGTRRVTLSVDSPRRPNLASLGAIPVTSPDGFSTELRNVAKVYLGGKEAERGRAGERPAGRPGCWSTSSRAPTSPRPSTRSARSSSRSTTTCRPATSSRWRWTRAARCARRWTGVQDELVLAALITGVVLFFFLHSLRSTIIVLLAIPTSLLVALIVDAGCSG